MDIYSLVSNFYQNIQTEKRIIGKSVLNRNLYAIKIGNGYPVGLVQYALHGREYITAMLALIHAQIGVQKGTLWVLPLTNPDGALLSERGIDSVENARIKNRLLTLNGKDDFSLWKANARGVDLNVNFNAEWGKGAKNTRIAGAENYIGKKPLSEPESRALARFTCRIRPDYTLSYHTKGEEIYRLFCYSSYTCPLETRLARRLSQTTGYPVKVAQNSAGGYKDWCIQALHIPSFTVEVGKDEYAHPLGESALDDIIRKNKYAIYQLSKEF